MKLLITAFEPFGGRTHNTSADLLHALLQTQKPAFINEITQEVLPVDFKTAWPRLRTTITESQPDFILLMGENNREGVSIERFARNKKTYINENSLISLGSPKLFETQIDVRALHASLRSTRRAYGTFCRLSMNAGSYLCNFIYFKTLQKETCIPSLFLHVQALPPEKFKELQTQFVSVVQAILMSINSQIKESRAGTSDTKAIDGAGANDMPRENKRRTLMADKHLVACEQEHEMVTVLKHFKKGSSKENVDKMQNACRSWKKDGGAKYKPKNRDNFYKYLQEKGILGKLA